MKKLFKIIYTISFILLLAGCSPKDKPVSAPAGDSQPWYADNRLIYHACGGIDGLSYTNSKEAMEKTLAEGKRIIEVDFNYTSDHYLVCVHNWDDAFFNLESQPDKARFSALKIQGKYSAMGIEDVITYMRQYDDLNIVIDAKPDNLPLVISTIKGRSGYDEDIMDRLIVQLYQPGQKAAVSRVYDFPEENYLFTCYKYSTDYEVILQLCRDEDINVVTVSTGKFPDEAMKIFADENIYVYEHTINRPDKAQSRLDNGVWGIYTDFLNESDLDF